MIRIPADVVRLYYNRGKEDGLKVWSVDFGPNTVELLATKVIVEVTGVTKQMTVTDREAFKKEFPLTEPVSAWLEFDEVEIILQYTSIVLQEPQK